jgi:hypothetical protein
MSQTFHAIFPWNPQGRYLLGHAMGGRIYRREAAAQRKADTWNAEPFPSNAPRGYVVRSSDLTIDARLCRITAAGRIIMDVLCTCPLPEQHHDPACGYHLAVGFVQAAESAA